MHILHLSAYGFTTVKSKRRQLTKSALPLEFAHMPPRPARSRERTPRTHAPRYTTPLSTRVTSRIALLRPSPTAHRSGARAQVQAPQHTATMDHGIPTHAHTTITTTTECSDDFRPQNRAAQWGMPCACAQLTGRVAPSIRPASTPPSPLPATTRAQTASPRPALRRLVTTTTSAPPCRHHLCIPHGTAEAEGRVTRITWRRRS